jgi:hypothetical protein
MEWYAQLGFGAAGIIADPTTLVGGSLIAKGVQVPLQASRAWKTSRAIRNTNTLAAWTATGALEGAFVNLPRLSGDHTYTSKDYQLDIMTDAAFGLGLGGIFEGGKAIYGKRLRDSRSKEIAELQDHVEKQNLTQTQLAEFPDPRFDDLGFEGIGEDLSHVGTGQAKAAEAQNFAQKQVSSWTNVEFTPWEAITEVSASGFELASRTLKVNAPANSPLRKLIERQENLNNRNLSPEERALANKLNADIVHIAAAFPGGRIPKNVNKALEGVTWNQVTRRPNHVIENVIKGKTTNPVKDLKDYIGSLKTQNIWDGVDTSNVRQSFRDFLNEHAYILSHESNVDVEDIMNLTQQVPQELSWIKDMIQINKIAETGSQEFVEVVEELNGLVSSRLTQRDMGTATGS